MHSTKFGTIKTVKILISLVARIVFLTSFFHRELQTTICVVLIRVCKFVGFKRSFVGLVDFLTKNDRLRCVLK